MFKIFIIILCILHINLKNISFLKGKMSTGYVFVSYFGCFELIYLNNFTNIFDELIIFFDFKIRYTCFLIKFVI